ncbi:MAG TPA: hypothetical protein VF131_05695 [Blastocatellia bacterium]|nr:hypothetical protein [Blastocatellia bacterium]
MLIPDPPPPQATDSEIITREGGKRLEPLRYTNVSVENVKGE